MSTALWADWKLQVDYWMLGECVGKLRLSRGSLERELAVGLIFWQKKRQVFVVVGSSCREG